VARGARFDIRARLRGESLRRVEDQNGMRIRVERENEVLKFALEVQHQGEGGARDQGCERRGPHEEGLRGEPVVRQHALDIAKRDRYRLFKLFIQREIVFEGVGAIRAWSFARWRVGAYLGAAIRDSHRVEESGRGCVPAARR